VGKTSHLALRSVGRDLHGDLRVRAAPAAAALQRSGVAAADAQPQEAHGGRVRPLPAAARHSGDGALAGAQPSVQILRECPLLVALRVGGPVGTEVCY